RWVSPPRHRDLVLPGWAEAMGGDLPRRGEGWPRNLLDAGRPRALDVGAPLRRHRSLDAVVGKRPEKGRVDLARRSSGWPGTTVGQCRKTGEREAVRRGTCRRLSLPALLIYSRYPAGGLHAFSRIRSRCVARRAHASHVRRRGTARPRAF